SLVGLRGNGAPLVVVGVRQAAETVLPGSGVEDALPRQVVGQILLGVAVLLVDLRVVVAEVIVPVLVEVFRRKYLESLVSLRLPLLDAGKPGLLLLAGNIGGIVLRGFRKAHAAR